MTPSEPSSAAADLPDGPLLLIATHLLSQCEMREKRRQARQSAAGVSSSWRRAVLALQWTGKLFSGSGKRPSQQRVASFAQWASTRNLCALRAAKTRLTAENQLACRPFMGRLLVLDIEWECRESSYQVLSALSSLQALKLSVGKGLLEDQRVLRGALLKLPELGALQVEYLGSERIAPMLWLSELVKLSNLGLIRSLFGEDLAAMPRLASLAVLPFHTQSFQSRVRADKCRFTSKLTSLTMEGVTVCGQGQSLPHLRKLSTINCRFWVREDLPYHLVPVVRLRQGLLLSTFPCKNLVELSHPGAYSFGHTNEDTVCEYGRELERIDRISLHAAFFRNMALLKDLRVLGLQQISGWELGPLVHNLPSGVEELVWKPMETEIANWSYISPTSRDVRAFHKLPALKRLTVLSSIDLEKLEALFAPLRRQLVKKGGGLTICSLEARREGLKKKRFAKDVLDCVVPAND